jgi:hypothetical protein
MPDLSRIVRNTLLHAPVIFSHNTVQTNEVRVSLLRRLRTHGASGRGSEGTRKRTARGCRHPKISVRTQVSQEAGLKIAGGDKADKHTRHTRHILETHQGAPNLSLNRYLTCGLVYCLLTCYRAFTHAD